MPVNDACKYRRRGDEFADKSLLKLKNYLRIILRPYKGRDAAPSTSERNGESLY